MRVTTWSKIFLFGIALSLGYLATEVSPPTNATGVQIGIGLVAWNLCLWIYTRYLIKRGKGGEKRPR